MQNGDLSGKRIVHIGAWARTFTQFSLPIVKRLNEICEAQIIYCSNEKSHVDRLREEGLEVRSCDISRRFGSGIPPQIYSLYKTLKTEKYDLCIAHEPLGALIGLPAAYLARIPVKIYQTGGLKYSPDVNGYKNVLYKYGEFSIMQIADAVLTVNEEDYDYLNNIRSLAQKAYYVGPRDGCGVDTGKFNPALRKAYRDGARKELGLSGNTTVIGYIGRIVWEKGFREIIESAKILRSKKLNFTFLILGDGIELDSVREQIRNESLNDYFMFPGYQFRLNYYVSAFDVFILPSYREGLPISLLEAMAMGIPSIATDIRGCRQLITDNKTGILIPARNSKALADAICRYAQSGDYAATVSNRAAQEIAAAYSEDIMVDRTLRIYRDIADKTLNHRRAHVRAEDQAHTGPRTRPAERDRG